MLGLGHWYTAFMKFPALALDGFDLYSVHKLAKIRTRGPALSITHWIEKEPKSRLSLVVTYVRLVRLDWSMSSGS